MANKNTKRCPASPIIREMQIKNMTRYHLTPVKIAVTEKTRNTSAGNNVE